jgi:hypothetical protein
MQALISGATAVAALAINENDIDHALAREAPPEPLQNPALELQTKTEVTRRGIRSLAACGARYGLFRFLVNFVAE